MPFWMSYVVHSDKTCLVHPNKGQLTADLYKSIHAKVRIVKFMCTKKSFADMECSLQ